METASTMIRIGTPIPEFTLPDSRDGRICSVAELMGDKGLVVAFLSNHCPYVKLMRGAFADFARAYLPRGIGVVAIMSNDVAAYPEDAPEHMRAVVRRQGFDFPYLYDETQAVARAFSAACTPDLFLFDASGKLFYRGEFDGARPGNGVPVSGNSLRGAADALLAGEPPPAQQRPSLGCNIKWRRGNEPDYSGLSAGRFRDSGE